MPRSLSQIVPTAGWQVHCPRPGVPLAAACRVHRVTSIHVPPCEAIPSCGSVKKTIRVSRPGGLCPRRDADLIRQVNFLSRQGNNYDYDQDLFKFIFEGPASPPADRGVHVIAVLGKQGIGKSTMLNTMVRRIRSSSLHLHLLGFDIVNQSPQHNMQTRSE